MRAFMCACGCACMHACMYACKCVCVCMRECVHQSTDQMKITDELTNVNRNPSNISSDDGEALQKWTLFHHSADAFLCHFHAAFQFQLTHKIKGKYCQLQLIKCTAFRALPPLKFISHHLTHKPPHPLRWRGWGRRDFISGATNEIVIWKHLVLTPWSGSVAKSSVL